MARELQRIQEEEAAAFEERVKQVAQRKREEERRNAKKGAKAKAKSRVWLGEHDDFAKARSSMKEFARCIWYAHEKDVRVVVRRHALKINTLSLEHDHGTSGLEHDHGTSGRPRPSSSPPCSSRPWRLRRSCALTARARSPAWSPATSPGNDEAGPKLTKKTDEIVSSRPRS